MHNAKCYFNIIILFCAHNNLHSACVYLGKHQLLVYYKKCCNSNSNSLNSKRTNKKVAQYEFLLRDSRKPTSYSVNLYGNFYFLLCSYPIAHGHTLCVYLYRIPSVSCQLCVCTLYLEIYGACVSIDLANDFVLQVEFLSISRLLHDQRTKLDVIED